MISWKDIHKDKDSLWLLAFCNGFDVKYRLIVKIFFSKYWRRMIESFRWVGIKTAINLSINFKFLREHESKKGREET